MKTIPEQLAELNEKVTALTAENKSLAEKVAAAEAALAAERAVRTSIDEKPLTGRARSIKAIEKSLSKWGEGGSHV